MLARHAGCHPEGAPFGVEFDDKATQHTVAQDASVRCRCPLQQGLADHYNSHSTFRTKRGKRTAKAQSSMRFVLTSRRRLSDVDRAPQPRPSWVQWCKMDIDS